MAPRTRLSLDVASFRFRSGMVFHDFPFSPVHVGCACHLDGVDFVSRDHSIVITMATVVVSELACRLLGAKSAEAKAESGTRLLPHKHPLSHWRASPSHSSSHKISLGTKRCE